MVVTEEYRTNIERRILEILANALESSQITEAESTSVARYILDHLDNVQSHPELVQFLSELAQKWPIFTEVGNTEMARAIEANKSTVTSNMETLIRQGNIQAALDAAKTLRVQ